MASSSQAALEECMEPNIEDLQACKGFSQKHPKGKAVASSSQQRALLYRLKKLRKKMDIYSRQIKKFNEESLNFNEMDRNDSAYMKVDALQRKLLKTWEEFCRVQGMSPKINVKYNTTQFSGTEFEELNKKINRLLDKSMDCFPDYIDVLTLVQRCTTKHNLPISSEEQGALSRRLFQNIIKELKKRRQGDFIKHFGSHLTDECMGTSDPALENPELHKMLERQHVDGEERLARVIDDFVVKQETNPQGSEQAAELEDDDKESGKDEESGREDVESERNGFDSDHSVVAETEHNSFEMTLELDEDGGTVEEGDSPAITPDADLPLDASPSPHNPSRSPLLPVITEEHSVTENTFTATSTSENASKQGKGLDGACTKPKGAKQEYSYDIIIIDD